MLNHILDLLYAILVPIAIALLAIDFANKNMTKQGVAAISPYIAIAAIVGIVLFVAVKIGTRMMVEKKRGRK